MHTDVYLQVHLRANCCQLLDGQCDPVYSWIDTQV